jgi:hypothetical protein
MAGGNARVHRCAAENLSLSPLPLEQLFGAAERDQNISAPDLDA